MPTHSRSARHAHRLRRLFPATALAAVVAVGLADRPGNAEEPGRGRPRGRANATEPPRATSPSPSNDRREFYPTAVGTQWVMKWRYFDGSGDPSLDVIRIVDEREINGYRKWKVRVTSRTPEENPLLAIVRAFAPSTDAEAFDFWEYYDIGLEAYVSRDIEDDTEAIPLLWYPAQLGDEFVDVDVITKLIDTGREVKVPAGTFECLVYEVDYTGDGRTQVISHQDADAAPGGEEPGDVPEEETEPPPTVVVEYWAKGVGLVRSDDYLVDEAGGRTLTARQELVSYSVPKAKPSSDEAEAESEAEPATDDGRAPAKPSEKDARPGKSRRN